MAQNYVSTYRNHFRFHGIIPTTSCKPEDDFVNVLPKEDCWLLPEHGDSDLLGEETDRWIEKLYRRRLWSTYQVHYCKDLIQEGDEPVSLGNELLEYCKNLYEPPKTPREINQPLAATRKMFGYIRPERLYTPLTTYQNCIGVTAYQIMKRSAKNQTVDTTSKLSDFKLGQVCNCNMV